MLSPTAFGLRDYSSMETLPNPVAIDLYERRGSERNVTDSFFCPELVSIAVGWEDIVCGRVHKGAVVRAFDRNRASVNWPDNRSTACVPSFEIEVYGSEPSSPGSLLEVSWNSLQKAIGFARNPQRSEHGWSTSVDVLGVRSTICRAKTLDVAWPNGSREWAEVIDLSPFGGDIVRREILSRVGASCCLTLSLPRSIEISGKKFVRSSVLMQRGRIALCVWCAA